MSKNCVENKVKKYLKYSVIFKDTAYNIVQTEQQNSKKIFLKLSIIFKDTAYNIVQTEQQNSKKKKKNKYHF